MTACLSESNRWRRDSVPTVPAVPRPRFSARDAVAVAAGAVALSALSVAAWRAEPDRSGVSLTSSAGAPSVPADLRSVDAPWSAGPPVWTAPASDLPLVARSEDEHIRLTQAFAGVMMPRLRAGAVAGFVIRQGAMPPAFARAGVRPGDIVVGINGTALTSNAIVSSLSRDLAGVRQIDLRIERSGRVEQLRASLVE